MRLLPPIFALLTFSALLGATRLSGQDYTWTGGAGASWSDQNSWSPNSVPNSPSANVYIYTSSRILLDSSYTIGKLRFASGTLSTQSTPCTLTLSDLLTWEHGDFDQEVKVILNGGAVRPTQTYGIARGSVTLPVGATFTDNSAYRLDGGGTLVIRGTLYGQSNDGGMWLAVNNTGTIVRRHGTGTYVLGVAGSTSSGNILVESGTLMLSGPIDLTGGNCTIASGTTLFLVSGTVGGTAFVSGAGTLQCGDVTFRAPISVDKLRVTGGAPIFAVDSTLGDVLVAQGGKLQATSGTTIDVNGRLTVIDGQLSGSEPRTIPPVINLNGGAVLGPLFGATLNFVTLNVPAGQTLADQSYITISSGSAVNNYGTISRSNAGGGWSGTGELNQRGTFNSASGFSISPRVTNTGSFNLTGPGTMRTSGSQGVVNRNGRFSAVAGATFALTAGTNVFSGPASTLTGAGTVQLGPTMVQETMSSTVSLLELQGLFQISSGQAVTQTGLLRLQGATLRGGAVLAQGGLELQSGTTPDDVLDGVRLTHSSGAVATLAAGSSASLLFQGGAVFRNDGAFLAQSDTGFLSMDASGVFQNVGSFTREAGSGNFTLTCAVDNAGSMAVSSGALLLLGPVSQLQGSVLEGGSWTVRSGATLAGAGLGAIATNRAVITLSGPGSSFAAIDGLSSNEGTFRVLGGRTFVTAGSFANHGLLELEGHLALGSPGAQLVNHPSAVLRGSGSFQGALFNAPEAVVSATSGASLVLSGSIANQGTIRAAAGATIDASNAQSFVNEGVLDRITGQILLPANFVNQGIVLEPSSVRLASAQFVGGTATLTIEGQPGHRYQLQRAADLESATFIDLGPPQSCLVAGTLTFVDPAASSVKGFYRIVVDP